MTILSFVLTLIVLRICFGPIRLGVRFFLNVGDEILKKKNFGTKYRYSDLANFGQKLKRDKRFL